MDLGIEAIVAYSTIPYYGRIWIVEFRDYTQALVIENRWDSPDANYVLEPS